MPIQVWNDLYKSTKWATTTTTTENKTTYSIETISTDFIRCSKTNKTWERETKLLYAFDRWLVNRGVPDETPVYAIHAFEPNLLIRTLFQIHFIHHSSDWMLRLPRHCLCFNYIIIAECTQHTRQFDNWLWMWALWGEIFDDYKYIFIKHLQQQQHQWHRSIFILYRLYVNKIDRSKAPIWLRLSLINAWNALQASALIHWTAIVTLALLLSCHFICVLYLCVCVR